MDTYNPRVNAIVVTDRDGARRRARAADAALTVAPVGFTPSGLPVGVQIVGPQYADRTTIDFARHLEREYQAFTPPPGYD